MRALLPIAFLATITACGGSDSTTPSSNTTRAGIYVTNPGNGSVTVYPLGATGNVAPSRTIAGTATGLSLPLGIGLDTHGNLYVANRTGSTVTVYADTASGNVAPKRILQATGMGSPEGLIVGAGGDLFVSACPGCGQGAGGVAAVFHFPNNATTSDYSLAGNNTGFTAPSGVAIDNANNLIVQNAFGGNVSVFAPGAQGNSLPLRSFSPGASRNVQSVAYGSNSILLGIPGAGIELYPVTASGTPSPAATLPPSGPLAITYPAAIFVDVSVPQPVIYLVDFGAAAIRIIQTAGTAPNLTVASVTSIAGAATGLNQPIGIAVVH